MVREDLVRMLVCPETHQPVKPAPAALRDKGGEPVERELEEGLLRDDGQVVYPVFDGIPRMLVERGIPVEAKEARTS
jgi:uncharacterized protein YbaR (Trm112 family)